MKNVPPGVYPLRDLGVACHLLVENSKCVLIDSGLTPLLRAALQKQMRALQLAPQSLKAILLTHGHLDHTANLAWIKQWSGAPVYVHRADELHVAGKFPYTRASKVCGWLETVGRAALRYRAVMCDKFFEDGDLLPFWGGLRVIHLPGHTAGHCGFYSERHNLLFSGDLFASYFFSVHSPPPILNTCAEKLASSFRRVIELKPKLIVTNHYDFCNGLLIQRRFQRLFQKRFATSA